MLCTQASSHLLSAKSAMTLQVTMVVSASYLLACALFVLSQHVHKGKSVLQNKISSEAVQSSPATPSPSSSAPLAELKTADVKLKELQARGKGAKRYHELGEKDRSYGFAPTAGSNSDSSSRYAKPVVSVPVAGHGKVSYEIKVYIPKHDTSSPDLSSQDRTAASELVPLRIESPTDNAPIRHLSPEDRFVLPSPHHKISRPIPSMARELFQAGPYDKPVYFVPVYSDEAMPEARPSQSKSYYNEPKPYYSEPESKVRYQDVSGEPKTSEEIDRGVTYVELKTVKLAEPAYPPSFKHKTSSPDMTPSMEVRGKYRPLDLVADYVPYDQQQTTDPPVSAERDVTYYEKPGPEPVQYEQRSRPYREPYGRPYYQPPPPPPPPSYQPSHYYIYPHQSYSQPPGYGSSGSSGPHMQYKQSHQSPRPIYSGFSYAAYAPYRRR